MTEAGRKSQRGRFKMRSAFFVTFYSMLRKT
jgi:hypothetical protein